ncbi:MULTISPECIES: DUF917 domain-containing protein [unclassified Clostridioides]|uniref:DUF917 domain-containing protein n=1 Tax=unclassified Clostridioides TaxID=2635829 RepID=UPI001D0C2412|nr:DUF917 family protein [Clostridioides sp. ES-S-0001-03]MCC0674063.1 DUF917 family protein [Clostridioides sp. ES-S-0145-01]MCC0763461.1 DUF917 family protein [Clostridioides sp. ES-S-0006-03]UDN61111.1 DUF917 family protein [Clostridioides sp. ES-W-0016-02]
MKLTKEILEYALIGGTILGGGGGGAKESGREMGEYALQHGFPNLISIDELHDDAIVLNVSAVGAPAAPLKYADNDDYINTVKIFIDKLGLDIQGIITNENGGCATINGWIQSSVLKIPLIDAPCNGRAHPTGLMGSLGLHRDKTYKSYQAVSGGNPELDNHIEGFVEGSLNKTAGLVRQCAVAAEGLVAVARNPVKASVVKENAAIGGISHAIDLGREFYLGLEISKDKAINNVVEFLNGDVVSEGTIEILELETTGGFDVGKLIVNGYEVTFWNEYMTIEKENNRIATFPDLIMTFDKNTGMPVTSAEIREGQEIVLIKTSKENLKLSITMTQEELLKDIEDILNKKIIGVN